MKDTGIMINGSLDTQREGTVTHEELGIWPTSMSARHFMIDRGTSMDTLAVEDLCLRVNFIAMTDIILTVTV